MKIPTSYELALFLEIDEYIIDEVIAQNTAVDSLDRIISQDDKNLEVNKEILVGNIASIKQTMDMFLSIDYTTYRSTDISYKLLAIFDISKH